MEGDHNRSEIQDLEDYDEFENENPFHEDGPTNPAKRVGLEGWLLHVLNLNGGVKVEVVNFCEKLHAEDYLDWAELESIYDEYDEDIKEIDVHLAQGESLVIQRVMTRMACIYIYKKSKEF